MKIIFLGNNRLFEVTTVYGNNEKMRGKYVFTAGKMNDLYR